jgi:hypothetical protein
VQARRSLEVNAAQKIDTQRLEGSSPKGLACHKNTERTLLQKIEGNMRNHDADLVWRPPFLGRLLTFSPLFRTPFFFNGKVLL